MKTYTLNVKRNKSLVGAAMPYRVFVNGELQGNLMVGDSLSINISDSHLVLKVSMAGNAMMFHKIEKEIVIFPEYSGKQLINCEISTSLNWIGALTMGLFQAIGKLKIGVEYI